MSCGISLLTLYLNRGGNGIGVASQRVIELRTLEFEGCGELYFTRIRNSYRARTEAGVAIEDWHVAVQEI